MAMSDAILMRLLSLHPKIIDLSLGRMQALLAKMGHPERKLPRVIHVAGTNGKGSTVAYLRAIMEAAGLSVHAYTSPHLVKFHERIRLSGDLIPEADLSSLLEECELANGGEPITFFEITTVAAFLAFARHPADYLLLEVGLGGRLDATNVIPETAVSVITPVDLDHQQYLGDTLTAIAGEKAGIIKPATPVIVGYQPDEARDAILRQAARMKAPTHVAGEDWQSYEEQGRLIFSDEAGLLDLPLPQLPGRFQIQNAGNAIAALRALADPRITDAHLAQGLKSVTWPARMQRLGQGHLSKLLPEGAELWLDGGHNPAGGKALAEAFAELEERNPKPLTLIWGMLNTKEAAGYIRPFAG
ncbi:MAG: bifunctional folylpolyglutamate synthase/dihydrofolate synthase, partial [Aestuariivirgaceae bacterium]|nr:bifunctional folylpolyglutamate synthase/dihydrofolate synthase [Aestuariivirgaceae bacterium]